MRILRIAYEWPPPWDGLAAAPYEMTAAQVELGHTVDVFCGRWPNAGPQEQVKNVTLHSFLRELLPGTLNLFVSPFVFIKYLFWIKRNPVDVIHSHGHLAIYIYWWRRMLKNKKPTAKELQIPLVVHFHNTVAGRSKKLEEKGKKVKFVSKYLAWPLAEKSDRWAVEVADAMIFVSPDLKKEAIELYGANPEKCFVVETGVNPELFKQVLPEEKYKTQTDLGLDSLDKVILNHGVMVERKNIHLLIEALALLPSDYKLLLVGPYPDKDYEYKLNDIISTKRVEDRIVRVGYTPYPEVPIAFQASDLFVLPSEWEGLPKVVMQALSCGVPSLASGFRATREISGLVYLENLTPENIAKQIKDMMENLPRVDTDFVRTHYSWHVMAKKVDQIYAKVTGALSQKPEHAIN